ncbi:MAG: response regulator [Candidatus Cloacimonetes bacterium]|nr:response regulator [Candidatus Cloacimonadota bacterium]
MKRIMLVEDEKIIATDIKMLLQDYGFDVAEVVSSGEEAIQKIVDLKPDLIIMDIMLAGKLNGIETMVLLHSQNLNYPVIYITAYSDEKTRKKAMVTNPEGYVTKPIEEDILFNTISRIFPN